MATETAFPAANMPGASLRFSPEEYVLFPNVAVFRSHRTKARDGRTLNFGMTELRAVCNRCNRRIAETGDYSAVVIGHTPAPEDTDGQQPELVGYAGPFRMGTIGEGDRKCWAILADFHIMRDSLAAVRKHPRRSPELCLEDTYDEMFLDPIALLGAEAPRLDLGLLTGAKGSDGAEAAPEQARRLYSFVRNGRTVEKYAMAACAAPAAGNVFAPQKADIPAKYAAGEQPASGPAATNSPIPKTPTPKTGATAMLTPEDISAVVEAFLATDAGQFLVQEMEAKNGTNAIVPGQEDPPAPAPEAAPGGAPAGMPGNTPAVGEEPPVELPPATPEATAEPPEVEEPEEIPPAGHAEPDGDEGAKKYAAACKYMDEQSDENVEKYLHGRWRHNPKWKKYSAAEGTIEGSGDGAAIPHGGILAGTPDPAGNGKVPATNLPAMEKSKEVGSEHYSRLAGEVGSLRSELAAERAKTAKVERYSRLQSLSAEFIMDPDAEMELVGDMTEGQFDRHVNRTIREHYQRNPIGLPWAVSETGATEPSHPGSTPKELTPKLAAVAVERYQRAKEKGEPVEFAAILEDVKAGR